MGRKMEPDVLATATADAVPGTPGTPAAAAVASPAPEPTATVKPVAAAAAAALADAAAVAPKATKRGKSAQAAADPGAASAAAVKTSRTVTADPPAKAVNAQVAEAATEPVKQEKAHAKPKLVRDSFTMPRADFALVAQLKDRALGFKRPVKKSELLRAGLHALAALDDTKLQAALAALTPLKAGRPKKG